MGVSFEEETVVSPATLVEQEAQAKGFAGFLVRTGMSSSHEGAQMTMIILAVLMICGSIGVYILTRPKEPVVSPADREELLIELRRGADGRSRSR